MSKQNPQELELLLNCYLDGELNESQAHKLEKQLANDPSAQQMLEELREVASCVGALPCEKAPEFLGQDILFELERNQLMTPHESSTEQAGKNHLFLRRFITAASLLILASVVGTITFQVLYGPIEPPGTEKELIAQNPTPPIEAVTEPASILAHVDPVSEIVIDEATLSFGRIHLEVLARPVPEGEGFASVLNDLGIKRMMQIPLSEHEQQFAFMCQAKQLTELFGHLTDQEGHQVGVVLTNSDTNQEVTLNAFDEAQLLQLATLEDPTQQLSLAQATMNLKLEEEVLTYQAHESLLPDWLGDTWAKNEPELTHLELLGPADWPKAPAPKLIAHDLVEIAVSTEINLEQTIAVTLTYKLPKLPVETLVQDPNRFLTK